MIENIDIDQIISQEHGNEEFNNQFMEYVKKQLDQIDIDKRVVHLPKKNKLAEENVQNSLDLDE